MHKAVHVPRENLARLHIFFPDRPEAPSKQEVKEKAEHIHCQSTEDMPHKSRNIWQRLGDLLVTSVLKNLCEIIN